MFELFQNHRVAKLNETLQARAELYTEKNVRLGTVNFIQHNPDFVEVRAEFMNIPISKEACGEYILGLHVHEGSSCDGPDFSGAGEHLNPNGCPHPAHMGDLMPVFINRNGTASYSYLTDRFSVSDILGRVVVLHSQRDDLTSQPSGDSGQKVACGLIARV